MGFCVLLRLIYSPIFKTCEFRERVGEPGKTQGETAKNMGKNIHVDTKVSYMGCCLHLIDVNVIMGVNEAKGIGRVIYKRGSNLFRERRAGKACK